jgi:hypothetical protein
VLAWAMAAAATGALGDGKHFAQGTELGLALNGAGHYASTPDHHLECMPGRLNTFQLSMLQWNDLHPYNAVHVVRIPGQLDLDRLKRVITTTLERKGLTGLSLDRSAGTYQYHGGPASAEIKVTGTEMASSPGCGEEIERQLNTPFAPKERFTPFRFVVAAERDAFSLGLVYFHPIADAESIVFLLKDMVDTYQATDGPGLANPLELYPARQDNLLHLHPGVLARKLVSLPSSLRAMRRTCRPHYRDAADTSNKFTFFSLGPQTLSGMIQAAKSFNVTLNDLFLALLMQAVSPLSPDRAGTGRRRSLSLGCIVNTRRDLGVDGKRTFGLFLGSFVVHHEVPARIGLADLARDIGRQTLAIKQRRLYLGSVLELTFGRLMVALFSEQRRRNLYQKHYPLWGGLTNMNLNALWPQPENTRPVDYFRAVSTGPATPLVVSVTTIGPVANIGLTYRSTVFGAPEIERVKACFLDPHGPLAQP